MTQNPAAETMAGPGPGGAAALGLGTSDGTPKTLNAELKPATGGRVWRSWALRTRTAGHDAFATAPAQVDNGDEAVTPPIRSHRSCCSVAASPARRLALCITVPAPADGAGIAADHPEVHHQQGG